MTKEKTSNPNSIIPLLIQEILAWQASLPLLGRREKFSGQSWVGLMLEEVAEAEEEVAVDPEKLTPEELEQAQLREALELVDVLVFLASEVARRGEGELDKFLNSATSLYINGTGSDHQFYHLLKWRINNLDANSNFQSEALHILTLVISRIGVLTKVPLEQLVRMTLQKNRANRPQGDEEDLDFFSDRYRGQLLDPTATKMKYDYNHVVIKEGLRRHFGSPLEIWMYLLASDIIRAWKLPEEGLAETQARLSEVDYLLVNLFLRGELIPDSKVEFKAGPQTVKTPVTPRMITHAMNVSGGVDLGVKQ